MSKTLPRWARLVMWLTVALTLSCMAAVVAAETPRSSTPREHFLKANPCPDGPDKGSTTRCRGYVIDHIYPLCLNGADDPSNMMWQTEAQGLIKDKLERVACSCKPPAAR
jgi:hypothetical protein